jgi:hypothetical protein
LGLALVTRGSLPHGADCPALPAIAPGTQPGTRTGDDQTRCRLEPYPPWLLVIRAGAALAAFGAVWLSVRGQRPYKYPTPEVIPVAIAFGILNLGATVAVARRATAGVRRRSRLCRGEITITALAWLGVFVVMAALAVAGVSDAFVYGTYPVTMPLMVSGVAWAGFMAARANWRKRLRHRRRRRRPARRPVNGPAALRRRCA